MSQPFTEYRGCVILIYPRVPVEDSLFGSPCTTYLRFTLEKVKDDIDAYRDVTPEPPPDVEEDAFIETYRDYDIWRRPEEGLFYSNMTATVTAIGETLAMCRSSINEYILELYPPEEPEEGLFAQVVAALKAWFLKNIQPWVEKWGKIVDNTITYVDESINYWGDQVTQYIDNSITYWTEEITNVYNDLRRYYDNSVTYVDESVDYWGDQITQNITNVIGASTEWVNDRLADNRAWVRAFFKLMDPMEFLRDPTGFIKAVFTLQSELAGTSMIGSFLEGFEEGLAEEVA